MATQLFCLLFWYNEERNWTVQNTTTIVKPRREPEEYKEGDLVKAKFQGKPYSAVIIRIKGDKDLLADDKIMFDNLLKNEELTPNMIMKKMGFQNIDLETEKTKESMTVESQKTETDRSPDSRCKKTKRNKNKEKNDGNPAKKARSVKEVLKEEKRQKQLASIEAAKIMAKQIASSPLIVDPIENRSSSQALSNQSQSVIHVSHSQHNQWQSSNRQYDQSQSENLISNLQQLQPHSASRIQNPTYNQTETQSISQVPAPDQLPQSNLLNNTVNVPSASTNLPSVRPAPSGVTNLSTLLPLKQLQPQSASQIQNPTYNQTETQSISQVLAPDQLPQSSLLNNTVNVPSASTNLPSVRPAPSGVTNLSTLLPLNSQNFPRNQQVYTSINNFHHLLPGYLETFEQEEKECTSNNEIWNCVNNANKTLYGQMEDDDMHHENTTDHTACQQKILELEKRLESLENKVKNLSDKVGNITANNCTASAFKTLPNKVSTIQSDVHVPTSETNENRPASLSGSQLVEFVPGTGVMITMNQLNACIRKSKESATALARLLLVVFFDLKTLGDSCARGTSSRKPLDGKILDAIIQYCMQFKKGTTEKEIIQAINNKCSDTRSEMLKSPKVKK